MDEKPVQEITKRSGQRGKPIKPPKRTPAEIEQMRLEFEMMESAEHKALAIEMLESMSEEGPVHVTSVGNLSEEIVRNMFSKMACQWCNFIPSPYRRYICPEGHLFCVPCGQERFIKHRGKCMIETRQDPTELKKEVPDESSSTLPVPVTLNPYHLTNGSNHFPVCQQQLRLYGADPVFASLWVCAVWKCPGGCGETFQGRDLLQHLMICMQDKLASLDEASDEMSEEENSEALVCVPEMEEPIVTSPPHNGVGCIVSGCSQQVLMRDVIEHVILRHGIYAMDAGDKEQWARRKAGLLYIPQSHIEARRPFYTLIRYCRRFFLFCMEPSQLNSTDVGFWIRRISNMENKEEENGPYFKYDLSMVDKFRDLQVIYKNSCIPWRKPSSEVFGESQCLTMPVSFILDHLVLIIEDKDSEDSDEDDEKGYLPMNFRILVENAVGDFYFDETNQPGTSSMESLANVGTSTSAIISDGSELTNEVDSKDSDVENDYIGDDEESDEDEGRRILVRNGIDGSNHKIKIWFETIYKDEGFSGQYSP